METINDFYQEYKDQSYLTEVLELSVGLDTDLLEKASSQCLRHLRVLCDGKEEVMVQVLQLFMSLPGARKRWKEQMPNRRAGNKERSQKEIRFREKLQKKIAPVVGTVLKLNPRIDKDDFEKTAQRLMNEILLEDYPAIKYRSPGGKPLFNRIITLIFIQCRPLFKRTERRDHAINTLIAKLLKSFHILNSKGNNYTTRDILRFVTEYSLPT